MQIGGTKVFELREIPRSAVGFCFSIQRHTSWSEGEGDLFRYELEFSRDGVEFSHWMSGGCHCDGDADMRLWCGGLNGWPGEADESVPPKRVPIVPLALRVTIIATCPFVSDAVEFVAT